MSMPFRTLAQILVLHLAIAAALGAAPRYRAYFGLTHGHSSEDDDDSLQQVPYERAFDVAGSAPQLDFFSMSSHSHMIQDGTYLRQKQVADERQSARLVTWWGVEWGKIGQSGHIGIYHASRRCGLSGDGRTDATAHVGALVDWFAGEPEAFAHFNHPDTSDFGGYYNPMLDPHVAGVEIVNGPSKNGRVDELIEPIDHTPKALLQLSRGWHVGLVANQDNHRPTFGLVTQSRTGVWAERKDRESITAAYRARRLFATRDHNFSVMLRVRVPGDRSAHAMGERLFGVAEVKVEVSGHDEDGEAVKEVQLFGGSVGSLVPPRVVARGGLAGFSHTLPATDQEQFVLARLVQEDGHEAWTSPVWFTSASEDVTEVRSFMRFAGTVATLGDHRDRLGAGDDLAARLVSSHQVLTDHLKRHQGRVGDMLLEAAADHPQALGEELARLVPTVGDPVALKALGRLLAGIRTALGDAGVAVPEIPAEPANPAPAVDPALAVKGSDLDRAAVTWLAALESAQGEEAGRIHLALGDVYLNLQGIETAIRHLDRAAGLLTGASRDGALLELGRAYDKRADAAPRAQRLPSFEKAIAAWQQVVDGSEEAGTVADARERQAKLFMAMVTATRDPAQYDRALALYQELSASEAEAVAVPALQGQASIYARNQYPGRDLDKAQAVLEEALERFPESRLVAGLHMGLGRLHRQRARGNEREEWLGRARGAFEAALSASGRADLRLLADLGDICYQAGDHPAALQYYQRIVDEHYSAKNGLEDAMFRIGECHEAMGQRDEAIQAYQRLIDSFPNHPPVYENAAGEEVGPDLGQVAKKIAALGN